MVAVSKTKSEDEILVLYNQGQKVFGENRVKELVAKYEALPKDISWHMIGVLQKNKVKYIAPFVDMIQSVSSLKLARVINKMAAKHQRVIKVLLQVKIAQEDAKSGFDLEQLYESVQELKAMDNIRIKGLMGMGTFTSDQEINLIEFESLKSCFDHLKAFKFKDQASFDTLSMGMSGDYKLAIECGSNMVRIGSLLFGAR